MSSEGGRDRQSLQHCSRLSLFPQALSEPGSVSGTSRASLAHGRHLPDDVVGGGRKEGTKEPRKEPTRETRPSSSSLMAGFAFAAPIPLLI